MITAHTYKYIYYIYIFIELHASRLRQTQVKREIVANWNKIATALRQI